MLGTAEVLHPGMNPFGFGQYVDAEIDRYTVRHLNNSNNRDKKLLSSGRLVGESVSVS